MTSFRDIKRKARRDTHRKLCVPALYYPTRTATPVPCNVRLHLKRETVAGATQVEKSGAEQALAEDRIRFDLDDFDAPLRTSGLVSIEPGEAWQIHHVYPADDSFQNARVTRLPEAECVDLAVPE